MTRDKALKAAHLALFCDVAPPKDRGMTRRVADALQAADAAAREECAEIALDFMREDTSRSDFNAACDGIADAIRASKRGDHV